MSELQFIKHARKPFVVHAVEVTVENIFQVAELIGEVKTDDDGFVYIDVDRKRVPNISTVRPGYFMTKMGTHIRCYTPKVFNRQFKKLNGAVQEAINEINSEDVVPTQPHFHGTVQYQQRQGHPVYDKNPAGM